MDRSSQRIKLHDGRILGFAEFGDPDGEPLVFFHGWPGSRYAAELIHREAEKLHIRVIAPDRPGMGLSDFQAGRRFLDWPHDVLELTRALRIKKFSVLGVSGGGPYALSCAYKIPDRLRYVGVVAGIGPFREMHASQKLKRNQLFYMYIMLTLARFTGIQLNAYRYFFKHCPRVSVKVLFRKVFGIPWQDGVAMGYDKILLRSILEALRQGTRGLVWEIALYTRRNWGFSLRNIHHPIMLWHSTNDPFIPLDLAEYVAREIPHCRSTFITGSGHAPLAYHVNDVLSQLI